jgi:Tudor domain
VLLLLPEMPVAAKFSEDDIWYRAEVTDLMEGSCIKVLYVDYGNEEVLPISRVLKLPPRFLNLPIQV